MHLTSRAIARRVVGMEKGAHIRVDTIDVEPITNIHIAGTPHISIVIIGPIDYPPVL